MDELQNLICKITSDIKSAEIGLSMLEGYLQGKGVLSGPLVVPELPAPSLSFGENLKALRIKGNLTQSELAHALNLAQSTIAQYETGERSPRNGVILVKIADFFGVPVEYLLGRRGK